MKRVIVRSSALFAWIFLGQFPPFSRADLVYFRQGGEAQLPVTIEGDRVTLIMPDGPVELRRDDFRAIVPGFWPEAEWETRRRKAQNMGFAARYAAAWWAIENGLTTEVIPEIRALHLVDSKHASTARMAAVLDRLDRPCADPDFAAFQRAWAATSWWLAGRTCCSCTSIPTPTPRSESRPWSACWRVIICSWPLRGSS